MNLKEIRSKISDEVEQAAAIADIMCVFSIVSGSKDSDLPLESIPNGIRLICDTLETHRKSLSIYTEYKCLTLPVYIAYKHNYKLFDGI